MGTCLVGTENPLWTRQHVAAQIAIADHPHEGALRHHGDVADVCSNHQVGGILDRARDINRHGILCHHILDFQKLQCVMCARHLTLLARCTANANACAAVVRSLLCCGSHGIAMADTVSLRLPRHHSFLVALFLGLGYGINGGADCALASASSMACNRRSCSLPVPRGTCPSVVCDSTTRRSKPSCSSEACPPGYCSTRTVTIRPLEIFTATRIN